MIMPYNFKKSLGLHPYKITAVCGLKPATVLSIWLMKNFFNITFFTGEAYFHIPYIFSINSFTSIYHDTSAVKTQDSHNTFEIHESCMMKRLMFELEYCVPIFPSKIVIFPQYCDNILFPFIAQLTEVKMSRPTFS